MEPTMSTSPAPISKSDRTLSLVFGLVFGIPGLYEVMTGILRDNAGEAVYGAGKVMIGLFFLLRLTQAARARGPVSRVVTTLIYLGGAVFVLGFLMKRGFV